MVDIDNNTNEPGMSKLEDVYTEWQNNPQFRQEFKKDPEQALIKAGLRLSQDDFKKIQSMLNIKKKSNDDDELEERINK